MIKASLLYHDPLDIYDHFKNDYGNLSMLIKGNFAIMTFENALVKKLILDNPRKIIKGLPLVVKPFEDSQPTSKLQDKESVSRRISSNQMDLQESIMTAEDLLMLGNSVNLPNINEKLKSLGGIYEQKIKDFKNYFMDQQICNQKITQFNTVLANYIKNTEKTFYTPFRNLAGVIRRFSINAQNDPIDLEPTFSTSPIIKKNSFGQNNLSSPYFYEGTAYANFGIGSVKRLCLLNQANFITTVKLNSKYQQNGQLRIYRKDRETPQFSLDIEVGPYSLMMHQNFILTGDSQGYVHFIDLDNQNTCEYSNKLYPGLIFQMQKYQAKTTLPSMISLMMGTRNEWKIKMFEIQKQNINPIVKSLTFHPKEQILCEGITMTMQALDDGKFAYGCLRNTYICPSFDKRERDYITHDHNVMKIKRRNAQELIEATEKKIVLLDLRASKLKNDIFEFKPQINTIELLSENYVFYGGKMGEIGLIDCRKPNTHIWSPSSSGHRGKISDILKIGNDVITADGNGSILQWKNQELK